MYKWAKDHKLITSNPIESLTAGTMPSRIKATIITPEQYKLLLEHSSPDFRQYLELLWETGARPNEIATIEAKHLDPINKVVRLTDHKTAHHNHDRIIYLTDRALQILTEQVELFPTGWLVRTQRRGCWNEDTRWERMARVRNKCNLRNIFLYSFRHTFATRALAQGVPDAIVAQLLGHKGTTILHKHYSHLAEQYKVLAGWLERMK